MNQILYVDYGRGHIHPCIIRRHFLKDNKAPLCVNNEVNQWQTIRIIFSLNHCALLADTGCEKGEL